MKPKHLLILWIATFLASIITLTCLSQPDRLRDKFDKKELVAKPLVKRDTVKADSLVLKPLIQDTIKADVSEKLTQELADVDTAGLNAKNDSIKQALIDLGATVSDDSVYVIGSDGAVLIHIDNLKKPSGKKFLDWAPYLISVLGILLIIFFASMKGLKKIPAIANSKNVMIQRFFAQTNKFWKQVQIFTVTVAGFGGSLLALNSQIGGIVPASWISVVQTLTIVCVAIAGGATFTSSKHGNNPTGSEVKPPTQN